MGVPRYHLDVKRMLHFMDDDTTMLEAPRFVRDGPDVPWVEASAERGKVSSKGEIVYLIDNVHMRQESRTGGLPIEVSTQYLEVMPNEDRVATDRPVVVRQGTSRLSGNAMQADGRARTFGMDGRVKGYYENRS
jgi:lipopolysaccharide export system protein LptC